MLRRVCIGIVSVVAIACSNAKIDRPAPPIRRTGPEMSTTTAMNRDTLFARAVAAVKERGYTEITPDQPHWQVRAKSPSRVSIVVSFTPVGDSTKVTVLATDARPTAGLDSDAMATVLTLMSDIAPPPAARVEQARPRER